jgi:hypothetical protein
LVASKADRHLVLEIKTLDARASKGSIDAAVVRALAGAARGNVKPVIALAAGSWVPPVFAQIRDALESAGVCLLLLAPDGHVEELVPVEPSRVYETGTPTT